jgi:hypothetical protein
LAEQVAARCRQAMPVLDCVLFCCSDTNQQGWDSGESRVTVMVLTLTLTYRVMIHLNERLANRIMCTVVCCSIKAIGYDMDYTLIHYDVNAWEVRPHMGSTGSPACWRSHLSSCSL